MSLKPPNAALALSDAPRALADVAFLNMAAPLLRKLPPAKRQHSVMVIPGFLGSDQGNGPLIRFLRHLGYQVTYVRNYTDVDDKIIARAAERGIDALALSASSASGCFLSRFGSVSGKAAGRMPG